jgi:hypothetical protein|tara:strand:+ start:4193 stop:4384 length:192 start_codon:yes stop_codon:yes gene_type:complete
MAKSMKVPVLIFEHKEEIEWLMDGLSIVLDKHEDVAHKLIRKQRLMTELEKIKEIIKKVNINN